MAYTKKNNAVEQLVTQTLRAGASKRETETERNRDKNCLIVN